MRNLLSALLSSHYMLLLSCKVSLELSLSFLLNCAPNTHPRSSSWSMLLMVLRGSFPSIFNSPKMSSISSSEFNVFFLLSSSLFFLLLLPPPEESDSGVVGPRVMLTFRPLLDQIRRGAYGSCDHHWPIRGHYPGHVTSIDQSRDLHPLIEYQHSPSGSKTLVEY